MLIVSYTATQQRTILAAHTNFKKSQKISLRNEFWDHQRHLLSITTLSKKSPTIANVHILKHLFLGIQATFKMNRIAFSEYLKNLPLWSMVINVDQSRNLMTFVICNCTLQDSIFCLSNTGFNFFFLIQVLLCCPCSLYNVDPMCRCSLYNWDPMWGEYGM